MHIPSFVSLSVFGAALAALATACSAAPGSPDSEPAGQSSEALCKNGVTPGCGACANGSQTCWTCAGSYRRSCGSPPPPPPPPPAAKITHMEVISSMTSGWTSPDAWSGQAVVTVSVPAGCTLMGAIWYGPNGGPQTTVDTYGNWGGGNGFVVNGPTTMEQAFSFANLPDNASVSATMECEQAGFGGEGTGVSVQGYNNF